MKKGIFLVIEGIDGSGKSIQIELLREYYSEKKVPFEIISFPRYKDNLYGKLIRRYLEGEFGDIGEVNPYLLALAYAGDRMLAKSTIEGWLNKGKVVIANRYTFSSKAHMGANISKDKREEFLKWLDDLEYGTNRLPKPDLTILLDVDSEIGQKNARQHKLRDIHEQNLVHLKNASQLYLRLSKTEPNWVVVNCMEGGKMRPIEDIHKDIVRIMNQEL